MASPDQAELRLEYRIAEWRETDEPDAMIDGMAAADLLTEAEQELRRLRARVQEMSKLVADAEDEMLDVADSMHRFACSLRELRKDALAQPRDVPSGGGIRTGFCAECADPLPPGHGDRDFCFLCCDRARSSDESGGRHLCTCTGSCRGAAGLGEGWRCALEKPSDGGGKEGGDV